MDLVNDYLRAVAALLPRAQRDDIVAELRDTILTRIEEREADLGRPLTDAEIEAVLREVGHPVVIAARYREGPQHVVGPALYPYWLFAVKAALLLQLAIALVVLLARTLAFDDFPNALGRAIGSSITGSLVLIGAATCVAWFIEHRGARIDYLDNWRVRDLRYLEIVAWDFADWRAWFAGRTRYPHRPHRARTARRAERASRASAADPEAAARPAPAATSAPRAAPSRPSAPPMPEPPPWHPAMRATARGLGCIAVGTVLVLWWTGVLPLGLGLDATDWAALDLDPGDLAKVNWMGLRALLFWPVLAYATAFLLQGAVLIAYPYAVRLVGLIETARGAALLAFVAWIWTASPLTSAVRVDNVADFVQRMAMFGRSPPLPLEPIATIVVVSVGFSALGLLGRGLWNLSFGGPPEYAYPPPHPGVSNGAV
jgi:hypothetical protein